MKKTVVFMLLLVVFFSGAVFAKRGLSEYFSINIDPYSRKQVGEKVWKKVEQFFVKAEQAIESENLDALMELYSSSYKNGDHKKDGAKQVWRRLFSKFDLLATHHNMRFITTTPNSEVMIIRCSGLLVGIPKDEKNLITIDSWTDADHVLNIETGEWKLVGSSGMERKRFWFDKPMHPLF